MRIEPRQDLLLMGPGPSNVAPSVLSALSEPIIGHLDPRFVAFMDELKSLLQYAFQTDSALTLPISAPGSTGMEACFVNLLEPGDTAVICINGVFGLRMKENAERCGARVIEVETPWGRAVELDKLEDTLKANPGVKLVAAVHAETSTGAKSDVEAICKLAKSHGALTLIDSVTGLAGIKLKVDDWGVDAIYSGTQKCLSAPPGLSPVSFSESAQKIIQNRKTKVQSWFNDMNLIMGYWGDGAARSYHHTAPINALYGLHESLLLLKQEGLENSWQRHADTHQALKQRLEGLGFEYLVPESERLPQLNSVKIPESVQDEGAFRKQLLETHSIEIGPGLGPLQGKIWRIGLMGHTCRLESVDRLCQALESLL